MDNSSSNSAKTNVIHAVKTWLPITENWIYNQIRFLPPDINWHIVAERVIDVDQKMSENVESLLSGYSMKRIARRIFNLDSHDQFARFVGNRCRAWDAHIVHTHFGNIASEIADRLSTMSIAHVVSFYGFDATRLPNESDEWTKRYKRLFNSVQLVLCEGVCMAKTIEKLGCPENKIRINNLGVEVEKIQYQPRTWQVGTPLKILMAASFREKKGFPDGIKALSLLKKDIDIQLTIIGDADSSESSQCEKSKIIQALNETGLIDNTNLFGYQPADALHEAAYQNHIFLAPSVTASNGDQEGGLPVILLEMAASGIPIVSTRHCDIPQAVKEGITGLLCDEHDIAGIAGSIEWLVSHSEAWGKMIAASRAHIETNYNANAQSLKLADIYRELAQIGDGDAPNIKRI